MTANGYNEEELKLVKETHKIWGEPDVRITATCIRVPVMRAHAESINLEFERDISGERAERRGKECMGGVLWGACRGPRGRRRRRVGTQWAWPCRPGGKGWLSWERLALGGPSIHAHAVQTQRAQRFTNTPPLLLCLPPPARAAAEEEALAALAGAPGVSIINDRANNRFPTPLDASNQDDVYVGR